MIKKLFLVLVVLALLALASPLRAQYICPGTDIKWTVEDAQHFTLCNAFDMAGSSFRTFPVPLIPMGEFNYAALSFSAGTLPDTLFYQIIMGSNPMDTLSVFALNGLTGPNETVRYIVKNDIPGATAASKAAYIPWPTTGVYMTLPIFDYVVGSTDGYPGIPKYIGVRVATCNNSAANDLKIVLTLVKTVKVGIN